MALQPAQPAAGQTPRALHKPRGAPKIATTPARQDTKMAPDSSLPQGQPPASDEPRLALVTGGSGGIGLEFARLLARDGFAVILVARDAARLEAAAGVVRAAGAAQVEVRVADLSDPVAVDMLGAEIARMELDVLVNNAGFGAYGPFVDADLDATEGMIATNIAALTLLTRAVLPGMLARGQGRIVQVASTAAFAPGPFAAVYAASKAYVLSFSEALSEELSETRIAVTALCPGPTHTGFAARAGMGATRVFRGPVADARTVAEAGYLAMLAGKRVEVVGLANRLMTFAVRLAPRRFLARVSRRAYGPPPEG
ncbi:SDR family NAD(P)-dependent oxidoreductase [Roseixanthobacter glucoisosaccharinicivorans]|uniref:SDR family NAD(P)-dependent oxidoreductase n=1 Tax=Roseixanthobacter glucoisosaccharinicivorans TaxID=3119923 RepID=UPI00372ADEB2